MWDSEFTTKAATQQEGFRIIRAQPLRCGPWPSCSPRPRLGSRGCLGGKVRRAATKGYSADHAGHEVEEHRAGHVLSAQGRVEKHVDSAEVRIVVAAVGLKSWPSGDLGL